MTDPRIQLGAYTFIWALQWDVDGARVAAWRASAAGLSIAAIEIAGKIRVASSMTTVASDYRLGGATAGKPARETLVSSFRPCPLPGQTRTTAVISTTTSGPQGTAFKP